MRESTFQSKCSRYRRLLAGELLRRFLLPSWLKRKTEQGMVNHSASMYCNENTETITQDVLQSYCASFALGLRQGKKVVGYPPRFHCPLHQKTCFGTAGTEAGLAGTGESAVKAGCCCAVSSHFSGGSAPRLEQAWTPRGSFSLWRTPERGGCSPWAWIHRQREDRGSQHYDVPNTVMWVSVGENLSSKSQSPFLGVGLAGSLLKLSGLLLHTSPVWVVPQLVLLQAHLCGKHCLTVGTAMTQLLSYGGLIQTQTWREGTQSELPPNVKITWQLVAVWGGW